MATSPTQGGGIGGWGDQCRGWGSVEQSACERVGWESFIFMSWLTEAFGYEVMCYELYSFSVVHLSS